MKKIYEVTVINTKYDGEPRRRVSVLANSVQSAVAKVPTDKHEEIISVHLLTELA